MALDAQELARLRSLLDRDEGIPALAALAAAIKHKGGDARPLQRVAVGLDTNVVLRIAGHRDRADILDYIRAGRIGAFVLPGQVIQEFWNNQFAVVHSTAEKIRRSFEALETDVKKIDASFGSYGDRAKALMTEIESEYGYLRDANTIAQISSVLEAAEAAAISEFVPRANFSDVALARRRTKTPPGFKDDGDGDFFVWADFLGGLLRARREGRVFESVVMVTAEKKPDWITGGVPHPILVAEVRALLDAEFEIWTVDRLGEAVRKELAANAENPDAG